MEDQEEVARQLLCSAWEQENVALAQQDAAYNKACRLHSQIKLLEARYSEMTKRELESICEMEKLEEEERLKQLQPSVSAPANKVVFSRPSNSLSLLLTSFPKL